MAPAAAILTNLLGNALKVHASGEVLLAIAPAGDENRWRFRIRDTGIGIAAEKQRRSSRLSARPIAPPPAATAAPVWG